MLNKIDLISWPKNQLQKVNNNSYTVNKMSAHNFKNIVTGLEKFYREKLDAIINHQTTHYDFDKLIEERDFDQLLDILELIMGVVVSCEDKELYIGKILELEERTQEDLQKLIERSLNRLQMDFAEPSQAATETPSTVFAMQMNVDSLEKEKESLRAKVGEIEGELRRRERTLEERDEQILML